MWNTILFFLGGLSVVGGIMSFPLPIPIGLPLMIVGLSLLIKTSPRTRDYIYYLAGRYPKYFRYFKFIDLSQNEKDKTG
ncbi:MAG: hypothetical protein PVJ72_07175 [Gammaproteobacteria bacterium]|jgi:hypothetical protein